MPRAAKGELLKRAPARPAAAKFTPASVLDVFMAFAEVPGHRTPTRPTWLLPLVALLDSTLAGSLGEQVVHFPPRVGKSLMQQAALIYWALVRPGHNHLWISCTESLAMAARTRTEAMAARAGLEPIGSGADLILRGGTKIRFTSAHASLVGHDCDGIAILDDVVRSREEYESPSQREKLAAWYEAELRSRFPPTVICTGHRWGTSDLQGWLIDQGAPYLRVPMICDDAATDPLGRAEGEILWPERYDRSAINLRMNDRRNWLAQYQGVPADTNPEERLFGADPSYYEGALPVGRDVFGADLARSGAGAKSDHSVMLHAVVAPGPRGPSLYVGTIIQMRGAQHAFRRVALGLYDKHDRAPVGFWAGPNEMREPCNELRAAGFALRAMPAQGRPKAQRYDVRLAPLWAEGRILLSREARHHAELAKQARCFRRDEKGGAHDDILDGLCAAVDISGLVPQSSTVLSAGYDRSVQARLAAAYGKHIRGNAGVLGSRSRDDVDAWTGARVRSVHSRDV